MSLEVGLTTKSTPASAITQESKSTQDQQRGKIVPPAAPQPTEAMGMRSQKSVQPNNSLLVGLSQQRPSVTSSDIARKPNAPNIEAPRSTPGEAPNETVVSGKKSSPILNTGNIPPSVAPSANVEQNSVSSRTNAEHELEEEVQIVRGIRELWQTDKKRAGSLRRSRKELNEDRLSLGEQLYRYKKLLVRRGRGGLWTSFLKQENIPRATADRYVEKWGRKTRPEPAKCVTDAFSGPSDSEIADLIKKIKPKLANSLTTQDSVAKFMALLTVALERPNRISQQ
jgi:hypothetical protein